MIQCVSHGFKSFWGLARSAVRIVHRCACGRFVLSRGCARTISMPHAQSVVSQTTVTAAGNMSSVRNFKKRIKTRMCFCSYISNNHWPHVETVHVIICDHQTSKSAGTLSCNDSVVLQGMNRSCVADSILQQLPPTCVLQQKNKKGKYDTCHSGQNIPDIVDSCIDNMQCVQ